MAHRPSSAYLGPPTPAQALPLRYRHFLLSATRARIAPAQARKEGGPQRRKWLLELSLCRRGRPRLVYGLPSPRACIRVRVCVHRHSPTASSPALCSHSFTRAQQRPTEGNDAEVGRACPLDLEGRAHPEYRRNILTPSLSTYIQTPLKLGSPHPIPFCPGYQTFARFFFSKAVDKMSHLLVYCKSKKRRHLMSGP